MSNPQLNKIGKNWDITASRVYSNSNTNLTLDGSGNSNLILKTNGTTRINLDGAGNIDLSNNSTLGITLNSILKIYDTPSNTGNAVGFYTSSEGSDIFNFRHWGVGTTSTFNLGLFSTNSNEMINTINVNARTKLNLYSPSIDVSGNTTFINALPTCSIVPTSGSQLVNKTYVDGAAAGFSTWTSFSSTVQTYHGITLKQTGVGAAIGCYYVKSGRLVFVRYNIYYSAFGAAGSPIGITLPFTPATNVIGPNGAIQGCCGSATWYSTSGTGGVSQFSLSACITTTNAGTLLYLYGGQSGSGASWFGELPSISLNFGDQFSAFITYETSS